jgi:hypothetical protein
LGGAAWGVTWLLRDRAQSNPDQVARDVQRIRPEKLDEIAKLAQLVLPPGCKWLDGYYYYWQEYSLCARFLLPANGFEAFLRDSKLPGPVAGLRPAEIARDGHPASKHDPQWHPQAPVKVSGIASDGLVTVNRTLMFDLDQAEMITVYLVVNDTGVSVSPSAAATA